MRSSPLRLLVPTALALPAALAACASTGTRGGGSFTCDATRGVRAFTGASEVFASDAAVSEAHPDDEVGALCADDDGTCSRGPMWFFWDEPTTSMGLLTIAGSSRIRHTGVFASPHDCVDVGQPTITWFGRHAVVSAVTAHVSPDPSCESEPSWTLAALVSKDTGRVELLASCPNHEATLVVLPDGERVSFTCEGKSQIVQIEDARACRP